MAVHADHFACGIVSVETVVEAGMSARDVNTITRGDGLFIIGDRLRRLSQADIFLIVRKILAVSREEVR